MARDVHNSTSPQFPGTAYPINFQSWGRGFEPLALTKISQQIQLIIEFGGAALRSTNPLWDDHGTDEINHLHFPACLARARSIRVAVKHPN